MGGNHCLLSSHLTLYSHSGLPELQYVLFFFFQQITVCPIILFSNYVPKISIYARIDVTVCDRHFLYVFILVTSILSTYSIY